VLDACAASGARLVHVSSTAVYGDTRLMHPTVDEETPLPALPERNILLALTYAVVVFSILVQGMSIGAVTRRATRDRAGTDPKSG